MTTPLTTTPSYELPQRTIIGTWLRRLLIGALIVMGSLVLLTWLAGVWAKSNLASQHPAPGQRVDMGGYQLHFNCSGEGTPTIIMEAGLNDFSLHWAKVQPEIALLTRVFTYDRAGLGWSDGSPHPRSSATIVDELHTLLTNAEVKGPYLLVGHSFGGLLMRSFAHQHAVDVVGMVLVDSAHEQQLARIPSLQNAAEQLVQQFGLLSTLSSVGLIALAPDQIPNQGLPNDALAAYRAILATTGYFSAAAAESSAFYTELESATDLTPLGDLPLIVLSRGKGEPFVGMTAAESEQLEESWQGMQAELATLSSNSQQIIAEKSGHYIQLQQPEVVIDAIAQLVNTSRQ